MAGNKRDLAVLFRERLAEAVRDHPGGLARFARDSGVDRSALSQFLDPGQLRLPRAETLRAIAEGSGASADWLLGLTNVRAGGPEIASSVAIEPEAAPPGAGGQPEATPLALWQSEAVGGKIRYVPSSLPDLFRLPEVADTAMEPGRASARAEHAAGLVTDALLRDTDVEICMAIQVIEALAGGQGIWGALEPALRRRQIQHMAVETERLYPSVRLHLFDATRTFSAPLTVFALKRAAIYLGRSYLVVTGADQVRGLARHFDELVREAVVAPQAVHRSLQAMAETG